ncbi:ribokinase [Aestuariivirga litoralis]|uniref:Ribokinase n=1 Tax=Aestuariivirga litoralis TaxID=2650924 RepID=A0A2W2ATS2_9HYPH|nr:ribokinase [Aestuariivirga litoralis]PZF78631.1 ribokinase [Aestuariivirga litoralis]
MTRGIAILGIFVADLAFRANRQPVMGETLMGSGFKMGPGGKGSNQAVAAARAGGSVSFISRLGKDAFGDIAIATWKAEGIAPHVAIAPDEPTGAAYIFVSDETGENAIIVVPGAAGGLSATDVDAARGAIEAAKVFVTQLEQPIAAARRGLEIARAAGVVTVFNPAPAAPVPDDLYALCDWVIPNQTEAAALTGLPVDTEDQARKAGDALLAKGARNALITLGARGALLHNAQGSVLIPSFSAGKVVETAGAGDAFVGAFATALAEGMDPAAAARFGCAAAGISVTRPGTAPAMPTRQEIETLLG